MSRYFFLIIIVFLMIPYTASANELHLVLNGKAVHFDNKDWNEENWGLGFEYHFEQKNSWIPFVAASAFLDSNEDVSKYLGGGAKKRYIINKKLHFDLGLLGFVMTRKDHHDNRPFVAALPFISAGNKRFAINATYIPRVDPKTIDLLYFQLLIKI